MLIRDCPIRWDTDHEWSVDSDLKNQSQFEGITLQLGSRDWKKLRQTPIMKTGSLGKTATYRYTKPLN
jgi:hypothetical protein